MLILNNEGGKKEIKLMKGIENLSEDIRTENFPNQAKETDIQAQEM